MGERARQAGFEAVHVSLLRDFTGLVEELGADPQKLLRDVGAEPGHLVLQHGTISYRQYCGLLEGAAAATGRSDFGLLLARRQGGVLAGALGAVMRNSRSFGEALEYVASHAYVHSLAARVWLHRLPDGNGIFAGHDILLDRLSSRTQAMEHILLSGHLSARELTGGVARARRVHFRHQPLSPEKVYRQHFGCPVRFGRTEDGVHYSPRDLAAAITASDRESFEMAAAYIEAHFPRRNPPLHAEVRGLVMRLLGTELCTNTRVAADLRLHPRTLHRRLAEEATSFQKIKDEVRRDFLHYFLSQTDLDFSRISHRLGFSEQSVLSRMCQSWHGVSPTQLRAALQA